MSAALVAELSAEVGEVLDELERLGATAHAVLKHPSLSDADRERALVQLLQYAKRSRVSALAAEALLRQIGSSIAGKLHEPPRPLGDGWARGQRTLRALGYTTCPVCGSHIADEATVRRLGVEEVISGA